MGTCYDKVKKRRVSQGMEMWINGLEAKNRMNAGEKEDFVFD